MKMLKRNLKEKSITLKIENLEDLWHLEHVVDAGDAVTSRTMRKTVIKSGDDMKYGDRKPMTLTIKTGKVEFQKDSGILRISGQITEGPEDAQRGSHHTLQVEEGSVLTIRKDWKPYQVRRIEKAGIKKPLMVICVLDREHCDVALLRESGMEIKTGIDNFDKENPAMWRGTWNVFWRAPGSARRQSSGSRTSVSCGAGMPRMKRLSSICHGSWSRQWI